MRETTVRHLEAAASITIVPSLFLYVRRSVIRESPFYTAHRWRGRVALPRARRGSARCRLAELGTLRLYSCSTQSCVAALRSEHEVQHFLLHGK